MVELPLNIQFYLCNSTHEILYLPSGWIVGSTKSGISVFRRIRTLRKTLVLRRFLTQKIDATTALSIYLASLVATKGSARKRSNSFVKHYGFVENELINFDLFSRANCLTINCQLCDKQLSEVQTYSRSNT